MWGPGWWGPGPWMMGFGWIFPLIGLTVALIFVIAMVRAMSPGWRLHVPGRASRRRELTALIRPGRAQVESAWRLRLTSKRSARLSRRSTRPWPVHRRVDSQYQTGKAGALALGYDSAALRDIPDEVIRTF
jgi:hypothetical protein